MMVFLGVAAALLYQVGFVLEKRALGAMPGLEARRPVRLVATLVRSPGWAAGFGCALAGLACQTVVLARLPLTVAQPLQVSGVVGTVVAARVLLGERPGRPVLLGLGVATAGIALLALSSDGSAGRHAPGAALYLTLAAGAVAAGLLVAAVPSPVPRAVAAGLLYGVAGLALKALSSELAGLPWPSRPLAAVLSPHAWTVAAFSAAGLLVFQTVLQRTRASLAVPLCTLTGTAFTLVAGTLLYGEPLPESTPLRAARLIGVLLAVGGALVLVTTEEEGAPHGTGRTHRPAARHRGLPHRQGPAAGVPGGPSRALQPPAAAFLPRHRRAAPSARHRRGAGG